MDGCVGAAPSPGWGPQRQGGQGLGKNRQGLGKNNWIDNVKDQHIGISYFLN